ncbi:MAG: hypothetical protein RIQ89_2267 [Bacteroidota bacterium]
MKWSTMMPVGLRKYYKQQVHLALINKRRGNVAEWWYYLERAHVLAQPYPIEHTRVHWLMLVFGIANKNGREIIGQLPRLLVGGVKSFVGRVPVGNTGGANVPGLQCMKIPADLQAMIDEGLTD